MLLSVVFFLAWCSKNQNFMDVDSWNNYQTIKNIIWDWSLKNINSSDILPDNLPKTRDEAKGYANSYYDDKLEWYVDTAKDNLSWTTQKLKGYYNSWIDQLNNTITNKLNWTISWELNKLKLK